MGLKENRIDGYKRHVDTLRGPSGDPFGREEQPPVQRRSLGTRKLTTCALLAAVALILSYIEFLLPINVGLPGIKIGLANIAVLLALYYLGAQYALYVNIARVLLAALLFGNLSSALYALAGGLVSLGVMVLLKKAGRFSPVAVSAAGGVFHNLAQVAVAALVTSTPGIFGYFPVLMLAGVIAGVFNGAVCILIMRKLR